MRDPAVIMAAILHDTVEDTDTTLDDIKKEFGPVVANIVSEVTDDKSLPYEERKRLQVQLYHSSVTRTISFTHFVVSIFSLH